MAICGQCSLNYFYVIEEPPEIDDIVVRRVTPMFGIRNAKSEKIHIALRAKQVKNKSINIESISKA